MELMDFTPLMKYYYACIYRYSSADPVVSTFKSLNIITHLQNQ